MEDLPTSLWMQQAQAKPRTGEELETFGKHASKLYLSGQCKTLSEAVVTSVKTASLSPEQVKRVVEFTNTSAFLEKFASEGPTHKVVTFEGGPASFPDVIRDLNDGGDPAVFDKAASLADYSEPPPDVETLASRNFHRLTGSLDTKLAEAFAVQEIPIPYAEPLRDAADMKDKVAGLYAEAQHEIDQLETRYLDLCDLLYGQVKQAALEGIPLGHILHIWQTVSTEPEFFKVAFEGLSPRLVENQVFNGMDAIAESLQKTAGVGQVNPAHPMVGIFTDFCDTLSKLAATRAVQNEIAAELDVLSTFLKKASAAEAGRATKGVLEYVPKAWGVARNLATQASKPVGEFMTEAVGPNAGTAAEWAVQHIPHAAVGLVGEEVYQRAKNQPAIQAVKNFTLSRVPYTHQNLVRQYNMQMGQ